MMWLKKNVYDDRWQSIDAWVQFWGHLVEHILPLWTGFDFDKELHDNDMHSTESFWLCQLRYSGNIEPVGLPYYFPLLTYHSFSLTQLLTFIKIRLFTAYLV